MRKRYGLMSNRLSRDEREEVLKLRRTDADFDASLQRRGNIKVDPTPFIEQAICSCAKLGFVGQKHSTFSDWIEHLRSGDFC